MNFQESRGPARLKPRQRRSIGYLAARMLDHLPNEPNPSERWEITIEQVMSRFDASRGSVYELFHVLEALLLVTKVSKNTFRWWGVKNLTQTLVFLRLTGLLLGFDKEIMQTKEAVATRAVFGIPLQESAPSNAGERQRKHILTVCQKFIMLFLVAEEPKVMSLEFASKVIHGHDLPDAIQKSRARRLYDVSNVMMALKSKYELMSKVCTTRACSQNRTAFQYTGPKLENIPLDMHVLSSLPDCRRNHLYFEVGKRLLGVPIQPNIIPNLVTMCRRPLESIGSCKVTAMNLSAPLTPDQITFIESTHFGLDFTLVELSLPEEVTHPTWANLEILDDCDYVKNLHWAILPNQNELEEFF